MQANPVVFTSVTFGRIMSHHVASCRIVSHRVTRCKAHRGLGCTSALRASPAAASSKPPTCRRSENRAGGEDRVDLYCFMLFPTFGCSVLSCPAVFDSEGFQSRFKSTATSITSIYILSGTGRSPMWSWTSCMNEIRLNCPATEGATATSELYTM